MAYHKNKIERGIYGNFSKIKEEFDELEDATQQDNKVLILCELADLIGAIEGYLETNHPGIALSDLIKMKDATKSAFLDGERTTGEIVIDAPWLNIDTSLGRTLSNTCRISAARDVKLFLTKTTRFFTTVPKVSETDTALFLYWSTHPADFYADIKFTGDNTFSVSTKHKILGESVLNNISLSTLDNDLSWLVELKPLLKETV